MLLRKTLKDFTKWMEKNVTVTSHSVSHFLKDMSYIWITYCCHSAFLTKSLSNETDVSYANLKKKKTYKK